MAPPLIDVWRQIIIGDQKSWVLFEYGTCVILTEPEESLSQQATELLREWGPVSPGGPAGDFSVIHLSDFYGWVIECHHPDILTYVSPEELKPPDTDIKQDRITVKIKGLLSRKKQPPEGFSDLDIGLLGRRKRHQDAQNLVVIHVEDKR